MRGILDQNRETQGAKWSWSPAPMVFEFWIIIAPHPVMEILYPCDMRGILDQNRETQGAKWSWSPVPMATQFWILIAPHPVMVPLRHARNFGSE